MNKKALFVLSFTFLFASAGIAFAHQPRISGQSAQNKVIEISNPEVSQAFYGNIKDWPAVYKISLSKAKNIYIGILSPNITGADKDFSVDVIGGGKHYFLDGANYKWGNFHEEFANDDYFKGPEGTFELAPGDTTLTVFSPDNTGKYVLVVGNKESFPPKEILKTLVSLPQMKIGFFGKSIFTIFFNKIGLYLFGFVAILAVLVIGIKIILKKKGQQTNL
jgi:hypothetical protein